MQEKINIIVIVTVIAGFALYYGLLDHRRIRPSPMNPNAAAIRVSGFYLGESLEEVIKRNPQLGLNGSVTSQSVSGNGPILDLITLEIKDGKVSSVYGRTLTIENLFLKADDSIERIESLLGAATTISDSEGPDRLKVFEFYPQHLKALVTVNSTRTMSGGFYLGK